MNRTSFQVADNHSKGVKITHQCTSCRDGDWIIYTCPSCAYELRENWRTGKMHVSNPNPLIQHYGGYFPNEYKNAFEDLN